METNALMHTDFLMCFLMSGCILLDSILLDFIAGFILAGIVENVKGGAPAERNVRETVVLGVLEPFGAIAQCVAENGVNRNAISLWFRRLIFLTEKIGQKASDRHPMEKCNKQMYINMLVFCYLSWYTKSRKERFYGTD